VVRAGNTVPRHPAVRVASGRIPAAFQILQLHPAQLSHLLEEVWRARRSPAKCGARSRNSYKHRRPEHHRRRRDLKAGKVTVTERRSADTVMGRIGGARPALVMREFRPPVPDQAGYR
jgi:hypothetical protein